MEFRSIYFLAGRDESPESYCHTPDFGISVCVRVRVHKNL